MELGREHPHRRLAAVGLAALTLTFSGCGKAAETGVEKLIESETGGDVDLNLDGDGDGGFSVQTEEGGMKVDADGNFVITDADGSVITGRADSETGEFSMESNDGGFRVDNSGDIPGEWPDDVPRPDGVKGASATVSQGEDGLAITFTGQIDASFVNKYSSALESAGYKRTSNFESDANITRVYENETWTVSVNSFPNGDGGQVAVSIFPVGS